MKKILLSFLFAISLSTIHAQDVSDIGKIALQFTMPLNIEGLPAETGYKLDTRIGELFTSSGLTTAGATPLFTVSTKFAINDTKVVEGGMQNITVVNVELSLLVKQVGTDILISSISKQFKGSGNNKVEAVNNAISKITPGDDYKNFIVTTKTKILEYYNGKCDDMFAKADNLSKAKQYADALEILESIPEDAKDCYKKAQEKAIVVYKAYQDQVCESIILEAKTYIASREWGVALDFLSEIDPSSKCRNEAENLIKTTATKVDAEEKKNWDLTLKTYNDNVELEKSRINAIKEVAIAVAKKEDPKHAHHSNKKTTKK